ncbi:MAG TPA: Uma2 family endonuclease [Pyrinomonadaceae bacterium]|nr:Uma2 family endonuclease [Pyrinomonadaceae bacterium]
MSATLTKPITADELLEMPDDGHCYELVKGELRMSPPPGFEHGEIAMKLAGPLYQHVKTNDLGVVFAAETGFKLESNPDTVRAPDVAFMRKERVLETGRLTGYSSGAPDLAVEVLSPSDRVTSVEEKVAEWLEAGARMVWVVSPKLHTVTVYRSLTDIVTLTVNDTLDGAEVVPGFQIKVAEIFTS